MLQHVNHQPSSSSSCQSSSFHQSPNDNGLLLLVPKWEVPDWCSFQPGPSVDWPPMEQPDSGIESAECSQRHSDSEGSEAQSPTVGSHKAEKPFEAAKGRGGVGGQERCAVCGDAATGFHYDVSSCNGCKTFFRRTIMAGRTFACKKGGNCQFNRDGRCACRACRFERCVKAGMNERAIQPMPSANLTLSIARKRFQRLQSEMRRGTKMLAVPSELVHGFEQALLELIGHTLRMEERMNRLRLSSFFPMDMELRIDQAVETESAFAEMDKYPLVQKWPPRPDPDVPHCEYPKLGVKFWLYTDLYLGMEYLKTLELFRELPREEKIALTKNVIGPNQLLSAALYSMQIRSEIVQYPDGYFPFQNKLSQLIPLEKQIIHGAVAAAQALRPDHVQSALIRAILLLDPNCDGISANARQRMEQLRSKMCRALQIYLQNRHGPDTGLKQFAESLNFIAALFRRQQVNKDYFVYRHYVLQNSAQIPLFWDFMDERTVGASSC